MLPRDKQKRASQIEKRAFWCDYQVEKWNQTIDWRRLATLLAK